MNPSPDSPVIEHDVLQAKREASLRFLAPFPEVPQFAALTMAGIRATTVPMLNVHAVGVGRKEVAGRHDAALAVRFYVLRKAPKSAVMPGNLLPTSIEGIPTDVIESSPATFASITNQRLAVRPVRAGASIAHPAVQAGTLGAICRREPDDGQRYALSNNHVLADLGRAGIGDLILQPAPADLPPSGVSQEVARLTAFEPISTSGGRNRMDAALAEFLPGLASRTTDPIGIGAAGAPKAPQEGMRAIKSGRTTGVTRGTVTDESYDVQIPLGGLGLVGSALFEDMFRVEASSGPVGNPGDSGALFLTDDEARLPLGMLFAVGAGGMYALACKLPPMLERFGVIIA
jgi:hypothetical protein